jgi:hypothetical protein
MKKEVDSQLLIHDQERTKRKGHHVGNIILMAYGSISV